MSFQYFIYHGDIYFFWNCNIKRINICLIRINHISFYKRIKREYLLLFIRFTCLRILFYSNFCLFFTFFSSTIFNCQFYIICSFFSISIARIGFCTCSTLSKIPQIKNNFSIFTFCTITMELNFFIRIIGRITYQLFKIYFVSKFNL